MKRALMMCCCCLLLSVPCDRVAAQQRAWPKIRAAYWWTPPPEKADEQLGMLQQHGLNTALLKDGSFRVRTERWSGWGQSAGRHGIALFPVLNWAGEEEIRDLSGQFRAYVNAQGQELTATPCPLDQQYWELAIAARFEELARLDATLAGVLFDTEMYGANVRIYDEPCLCDVCWAAFARRQHSAFARQHSAFITAEIPREARYATLIEGGQLDAYLAFQEQSVQSIAADLARRVHAIQPGFDLGVLFYRDNWFYHGLVTGLGTAQNPALVFSENSYSRGYTPEIAAEYAALHRLTPEPQHVRHIAGLWLGRFLPPDLAAQAYYLGTATDGYWLFSADSLWRDHNAGAYALNGSHAEHWAAFRQANAELTRFEAAPATYRPSFPALHPSSYYDAARKQLSTPAHLPEFLNERTAAWIPAIRTDTTAPIYRGTTLIHVRNTVGAQIRITHVPLGTYMQPTRYTLFDEQGRIVSEGQVDREHPTTALALTDAAEGVLSLLADSGMNAMRIAVSGAPAVIEASVTFPLATIGSPLTYAFAAPDHQERVTVRAMCTEQEPARLTMRDSGQQITARLDVTAFTVFTVPIPENRATPSADEVWTLEVAPVPNAYFEDVFFSFYQAEFPYVMLMPQP